jgi:hypothetical protein
MGHGAIDAESVTMPPEEGFAARLVAAIEADGIDLRDRRAVDQWMAEFNAGPIERRDEILGPLPDRGLSGPISLPPLPAPDPAQVQAAAAAAPILTTFARLSEYIGTGKALTKTGNLRLVDAKALVDVLETGDTIDPTYFDMPSKTRSAADLGRLDTIYQWAKEARVVRVQHGKVLASKTWQAQQRKPVDALDRAVDAMLHWGALGIQRLWVSAYREHADRALDAHMVHVVAMAYARDSVPFDEAARWLEGFVRGFGALGQIEVAAEERTEYVEESLSIALRSLTACALVEWTGSETVTLKYERTAPRGGELSVTPYGADWCQRNLSHYGFEVHLLRPFSATAADADPTIIEALADQAEGDPLGFHEAFTSLGNHAWQILFVQRAWRVPGRDTELVLRVISATTGDRVLRKAARKAVMQHQSAFPNR